MFCPKCAAENIDQTRFCRGCGADIEAVALALNSQLTPRELLDSDDYPELIKQRTDLRIDGIRQLLRGALIFVTGLLLGIPLAVFGEGADWHANWILVWLVLCGWLPVWGAFMTSTGLSNLIESRGIERQIEGLNSSLDTLSVKRQVQTQRISESEPAVEGGASSSPSERTTASMSKNNPGVL